MKEAEKSRERLLAELADCRRAQEALRRRCEELEERARLLDSTIDAIMLLDLDGTIRYWNQEAERKYGWSQEEALGQDARVLLDSIFPEPIESIRARLLETGRWRGDVIHTRKDGTTLTVDSRWSLNRSQSGAPISILEVSSDITEFKYVREMLETIFAAVPAMIFYLDREDRFVRVNPAFARAFGYEPQALIGRTLVDLLPEDFARRAAADNRMVVTSGQPRQGIFECYETLEGKHCFHTDKIPFRDKWGNLIGVIGISTDITAIVNKEEALRKSEGLLRQLLDTIPVGVWVVNQDGTVQFENQVARKIWGGERCFGLREFESYRGWWPDGRRVGPQEWPVVKALRGIPTEGAILELEPPGEGRKNTLVSATPIRDAGGTVLGAVVVHLDITALKQGEVSLRRSKERFENLVNAVDGIVWEAEAPPLRFTFVSKKAERLLGYPAEAWSEEPDFWRNHIHPDDRDWVTDYCAKSSRLREAHQFEYRMIAADGRIIWLRDMVVVSATGDDSVKLQGIMVDITERKQAEGELERLKRQHELILNSAGEGIFGIDSEGRALFANPAAAKMLGFSVEELLHQFLHPLIHHTRADGTPFPLDECPNRLIMKDGRTRVVEHDLFWRKDGTSFPVERVVAAIRIEDRIVGTVNIFQDITEREREQQQRQQFEALKQVDALKDQFLSILSHELRTPINSITGFGSLLQDEVAGPLNETQAHYLDRMLNGAETLLSLVNDLLDMSRIQAGKFTLSPHAFDFSQLVEEVLKDLSPLSGEKKQHLENAVPSALTLVADEQRIRQVLVNLLGNAIKFTPEGGTIAVRAYTEENGLVFEVEDNGLGIAPEDLPKLFRPFTQIDMTVTRQATGTGLGLSIAKALVEAHGGSISVSSPGLGRGATFSVRIPGTPKKGEAL